MPDCALATMCELEGLLWEIPLKESSWTEKGLSQVRCGRSSLWVASVHDDPRACLSSSSCFSTGWWTSARSIRLVICLVFTEHIVEVWAVSEVLSSQFWANGKNLAEGFANRQSSRVTHHKDATGKTRVIGVSRLLNEKTWLGICLCSVHKHVHTQTYTCKYERKSWSCVAKALVWSASYVHACLFLFCPWACVFLCVCACACEYVCVLCAAERFRCG